MKIDEMPTGYDEWITSGPNETEAAYCPDCGEIMEYDDFQEKDVCPFCNGEEDDDDQDA